MAHGTFHLSAGLAVGTLAMLPTVLRHLANRRKIAELFLKWFVLSGYLGMFALVPSFLRRMGVPNDFVSGWWMSIFVLHPLLDTIEREGMLVGQLGIVGCLGLQYVLLLIAIRRANPPAP